MFSNQKKGFIKSKWFYGLLILFLLAFGIWVNYDGNSQNVNTVTEVSEKTQNQTQESQPVVDSLDQETTEKESENEAAQTEEKQQTYYLIKEVEDVVKVFYCDENGQEDLYQITTVPFQLLSTEDQQLLSEGVRVEDENELADFLENFDS
ncbi:BofC C-terminal domain-containing protein [Zhenpiania hominis]|mgnify:CR=1 FL=1|uniref:BofC C-terminal domain-containing protein n=1 Tax=Zhenpiania hominis TaxID=2763644 RepID=A0A923NJS8_9FIRM|nr:BofC C-terminal domain-containing protein [Zhenpiania hominis]MBC6679200.1 BofC C-terminal domain-containing protein [Zhenpiania hominis]